MSPRKAYDQVAGDILAKNKDVDIKALSGTILRKEYEHQAKQYSMRQDINVRRDARELATLLGGGAAEDEAQKKADAEQAAREKAEDALADKLAEKARATEEAKLAAEKATQLEAAREKEAAAAKAAAAEEATKKKEVELDLKQ